MLNSKYFLLIDDDADDQEIFSLAVNQADETFSCICTDDCIDAINKFTHDEQFQPKAIFIDMNMPRINGLECLREVRKIDHHKTTPVFIYTTSSDWRIKEQSLQLGATGYINKPSSLNELVLLINDLIVTRSLN